MSIKFFIWGGVFWVGGGGEFRFYFYGRTDFSDLCRVHVHSSQKSSDFMPRRALSDRAADMFRACSPETYHTRIMR